MTLKLTAPWFPSLMALAMLLGTFGTARAQISEPATTQPVTDTQTPEAKAPPDAETPEPETPKAETPQLQKDIAAAYDALKAARFEGRFSARTDVAGQQANDGFPFISAFSGEFGFRHEAHGQEVWVGNKEGVYIYSLSRNEVLQADPFNGKMSSLPGEMQDTIEQTNPALALAMAESAEEVLSENVKSAAPGEAIEIEGKSYPTLVLTVDLGYTLTLAVDEQTHLIRRATFDLAEMLKADGTPEVKTAELTIDYTAIDPAIELAADAFAFEKKEGALVRDYRRNPQDIIGQKPPAFELANLAGEMVTLDSIIGKNVVVLDFWASWCAPCREGLPHMVELNAAEGVDVYAINVSEPLETAKGFIESQGLDLPVLLDVDGVASKAYALAGIPHTVVIDRRGRVVDVIVGLDPPRLDKAIEKAGASQD